MRIAVFPVIMTLAGVVLCGLSINNWPTLERLRAADRARVLAELANEQVAMQQRSQREQALQRAEQAQRLAQQRQGVDQRYLPEIRALEQQLLSFASTDQTQVRVYRRLQQTRALHRADWERITALEHAQALVLQQAGLAAAQADQQRFWQQQQAQLATLAQRDYRHDPRLRALPLATLGMGVVLLLAAASRLRAALKLSYVRWQAYRGVQRTLHAGVSALQDVYRSEEALRAAIVRDRQALERRVQQIMQDSLR